MNEKKTKPIPRPGQPVRGSKTGEPIMALFDLMGRRWAMGILWALNKQGPSTFRELQAYCDGLSPTVLNTRLKELRAAGLVDHGECGYQALPLGKELFELLVPMGRWAVQWGKALESTKTD
ncbi:winged helix-turn-helix transcriptional regulator [Aestuariispira insulae]|uniref:HxlR family transcriptional regulator n=1 Tax=Aestuariispira insulae TaxID=1461337 RepID=A0A3D9HEV4_9PROT|nr:helix-turn-helix domain-containing protein [Aestuariispira insulae]RED48008.1 HxlR family transcriptional regulator [Aestuariispira insulae]